MFNFLKKKSSSINVSFLSFETFGYTIKDKDTYLKSWVKPDKTGFVGIEFHGVPYPHKINEIEKIIEYEREHIITSDFGGVISCKVLNIDGFNFVETIVKSPVSPTGIPSGMNYIGTLKLPLKNGHFEIMIKTCENGITGIRDSMIFSKWFQENEGLESHENGQIKGWVKDPYDESIINGRPMNVSELEKYDVDFPDHPLSDLRKKIATLKDSLKINEKTKEYQLQ